MNDLSRVWWTSCMRIFCLSAIEAALAGMQSQAGLYLLSPFAQRDLHLKGACIEWTSGDGSDGGS